MIRNENKAMKLRPLYAILLACCLALAGKPVFSAPATESPFEPQLMRLAEILGSLHYLRNLCGEDGEEWLNHMEAFLEAENPDAARRSRLISSFNRGYRSFETSYASCTDSALAAITRYMKEGEALSRDTAARYGN